ncbi:MAG: hypothetical protein BA867_13170 [Desulfobacterales bacterium S5133MH16]|nr:MAG: hypothetical protein BA867_13170 [Desulfobacterales bacterium S5133MH16]
MISREQVDEIKASIDIIKFINDSDNVSFKLTDHGDEWKGAILSSSKEGRSLSVNPKSNKWVDHASQNGGNDVLSWIAYRENLDLKKDFQEIVKIAADYAGIKIKNINENDEKEHVFATMGAAVRYYHKQLSDECREYLNENWGLSNKTIDKQLIGYAPLDGASLQMGLKDVVHQDDLIKAGLVYDNSKIDVYRGRFIFPYLKNNRVVYTIGRRTDRTPKRKNKKTGGMEKASKYLKNPVKTENNPHISKFVNNDVFFGVDTIKGADEVVITEGMTDAIALLQADIPCISPVTTQFKKTTLPDMLQLVKEIKYIYVCNDNDGTEEEEGPGDKGAFKTIDYLTENGLEVRYIQLPRHDDVDKIDLAEYMKGHTVEDFRSLMDNAVVHKPGNVTKTYGMTDRGNAQRMNDLYGEDLLYCPGSKKWLTWNSNRWEEDDMGIIYKLAKKTVEAMHDYADNIDDETLSNKWQKYAFLSESTAKYKAMVENLQSEEGIPIKIGDMDLNGWILPALNGTIDLRTGKLRESRREDLCTKTINVIYNPAASCPTWNKFLNEVLPDPDTQRYVKECLGSALTGDTSEENLFILYGTGSNGKSVLMDTVSLLLSGFAINVKASTLLTSNKTQPTQDNEIARLWGARLATASEPKKGISLSDDVIKTITNSKAKITARKLYQEPFDFYPTHKTFFSSNHKPTVSDHSRGVWRRLRLIPFVTSIEDEDQDLNLSDKLEKELPGILNWLVEGCLSWQKAGRLIMSAEVEKETDEYRADQDRLTEFLSTVTTAGGYSDKVSNMWLRDSYNEWAERMGFKPMNDRTFSAAMSERDFKKVKTDGYIYWRGLKQIITKIGDINKTVAREVQGGSREDKTPSREDVELLSDILKRLENNLHGSCDIEDVIKYIKKEVSQITSTSSLAIESASLNSPLSPLIPKIEDGPQTYLTKEQKNQIIEDVIKDHGEKPTNDTVMYLAGLIHKRKDVYSQYDAVADIRKKYKLDVKPSKEASNKLMANLKGGNGVLLEIERRLKNKYTGDDLQNLYNIIQDDRYKQNGDNGKLKPIGDIDGYCDALLGRNAELRNYKGPTKDILKIVVEYDNNGGGST